MTVFVRCSFYVVCDLVCDSKITVCSTYAWLEKLAVRQSTCTCPQNQAGMLDLFFSCLLFFHRVSFLFVSAAAPAQPAVELPNKILFITQLPEEANEMMVKMLFNQ